MPEPFAVPVPAPLSLSQQLQSVTQALAAAQRQTEILRVGLGAAVQALEALGGTVLLVRGQRLQRALVQGHADPAQVLWHDGPLNPATPAPATDALHWQRPLLFSGVGALLAAYPALAGAPVPVASAVLPIVLDGQPLGVMALDFREPQQFGEEQLAYLEALAGHCAAALGRAGVSALLEQRAEEGAEALDAFVRFTEAVGSETDELALAQQAVEVLQTRFRDGSVAYYELSGELWTARALSDNMPAALQTQLRAGLPGSTPLICAALASRQAYFTEAWDPEREQISQSGGYGTAAAVPLVVGGRVRQLLMCGLRDTQCWSERDQALVRAVGRSLTLALERTRQARLLEEERAALAAFVAFSEVAGNETNVLVLVRQAAALLRRTRDVDVMYFERSGDLFRPVLWSDGVPRALLDRCQQGFGPGLPSLWLAQQQRGIVFIDDWNAEEQAVPEAELYGAVAVQPFFRESQLTSLLVMASRRQRAWSERDQGIFASAGRSLGLALERAEVAARLEAQNTELEAQKTELEAQKAELEVRTRALEAFVDLTRELPQSSEPYALIERAGRMLMSLLPRGYVAYWEQERGRWYARVQVNDAGSPELQATIDAGLPVGQTPTLDIPYRTRQGYFQDAYVQGADTAPEVVDHIRAVACAPLLVGGQVRGVVNVPLFETRSWSTVDRAVLMTAVQSLGLALERAQGLTSLAERSRQLEYSNQELLNVNRELEAFGYSLSHDLRAPVRHIKGFAELARRAVAQPIQSRPVQNQTATQHPSPTAAAQGTDQPPNLAVLRHLQIIDQAAERMSGLIDAMLSYSRSARQDLRPVPVDLSAVIRRAQEDTRPDTEGRTVEWRVAALPTVLGDQDGLQQVFTNLVANALKFSRQRSPAVIEVWAREEAQAWSVWVRDNGVGFNAAHRERLFGVFQRLHSDRDFEGTGVGLATVQRIVLRHGGQVEADGQEGQGATFRITLPKQPFTGPVPAAPV